MHFESGDTPLKEDHISILHTDGPGLSPNEPMAVVQIPIVQVKSPSIPDGRYIIKSRAGGIYWSWYTTPMKTVYFWSGTMEQAMNIHNGGQVNDHSPISQVFKG